MEMLARTDLLLVPRSIAVDQAVQDAEAIALAVTRRRCARRGHKLAGRETCRPIAIREHPAMGRSCLDRAPELRDVASRQPHSAPSRPLLERRRQLDLDERLATEALDV